VCDGMGASWYNVMVSEKEGKFGAGIGQMSVIGVPICD
jgi:hypothetical protein